MQRAWRRYRARAWAASLYFARVLDAALPCMMAAGAAAVSSHHHHHHHHQGAREGGWGDGEGGGEGDGEREVGAADGVEAGLRRQQESFLASVAPCCIAMLSRLVVLSPSKWELRKLRPGELRGWKEWKSRTRNDLNDDSDNDDDDEKTWVERTAGDGRIYYEHTRTGEASWEPPVQFLVERERAAVAAKRRATVSVLANGGNAEDARHAHDHNAGARWRRQWGKERADEAKRMTEAAKKTAEAATEAARAMEEKKKSEGGRCGLCHCWPCRCGTTTTEAGNAEMEAEIMRELAAEGIVHPNQRTNESGGDEGKEGHDGRDGRDGHAWPEGQEGHCAMCRWDPCRCGEVRSLHREVTKVAQYHKARSYVDAEPLLRAATERAGRLARWWLSLRFGGQRTLRSSLVALRRTVWERRAKWSFERWKQSTAVIKVRGAVIFAHTHVCVCVCACARALCWVTVRVLKY